MQRKAKARRALQKQIKRLKQQAGEDRYGQFRRSVQATDKDKDSRRSNQKRKLDKYLKGSEDSI